MAEESGSQKSDDLNEILIVMMRQYLLQNANRESVGAAASGLPACTGARQPARRPAAHRTRRGHRQGDARALFFSLPPSLPATENYFIRGSQIIRPGSH